MKEQKTLVNFCRRLVALDMDIFGLRKQAQDAESEGEIKGWRTLENGVHFPIKEGESVKEAGKRFVAKKASARTLKKYIDQYSGKLPENLRPIEGIFLNAKREAAGKVTDEDYGEKPETFVEAVVEKYIPIIEDYLEKKKETPRPVISKNKIFPEWEKFNSVAELYEAIAEHDNLHDRAMQEGVLKEGRDFEYVK